MYGIYIHIPFCKKACHYCDFHFSTSLKYADEMVETICKEIKMKKDRIHGQVGSIYLGGGTPSILSENALQKIFDTINHTFSVDANAEITIETNPDDLTARKLKELKQLPVNRFSIGIQSFYDEDLIWMNRAHLAREAEDCIRRSQDAGFENLTLDLIYGYPLLTDQKWLKNIRKAIELEVPHISAYALTVEPRTALAHAIKNKKQTPDDPGHDHPEKPPQLRKVTQQKRRPQNDRRANDHRQKQQAPRKHDQCAKNQKIRTRMRHPTSHQPRYRLPRSPIHPTHRSIHFLFVIRRLAQQWIDPRLPASYD